MWMIIILAALLFPSILMKELAELKIVSLSLFGAALLFVLLNITTFAGRGKYVELDPTLESTYMMSKNFGSADFIQSIVIMFTACNF
jgi:amino acid permease